MMSEYPNGERRQLLRAGVAWAGAACFGNTGRLIEQLAAQAGCAEAGAHGELLGLTPLYGERRGETTFGQVVNGPGLDARLYTDHSVLQADQLITPTPRVFVRTSAPASIDSRPRPWTIAATGWGEGPATVSHTDLVRAARPMGAHLIECSGNATADHFGLMSVAEWDGVPLADVVSRLGKPTNATAVLVSGVDHETATARSVPGASWVFPLDALSSLGLFLAVRINGEPLPPDHGAPVRLVVPGWYGCTWIKWVNELRLVGPDEPATAQMREFAARTHQDGVPALARDYQPASIDLAAMPVRVEKRRVGGRLAYRIVGIVWGGTKPADRLMIRCGASDAFATFPICPAPRTHASWSMWDYTWHPPQPGEYQIVVKAADSSIRTRRLDRFFYARKVTIGDV